MSERLVVDSIMTADKEVVPLGPVDKEGRRVPLDTRELYDEDGKCLTVRCFLHFPFTNEWFIEETLSRGRFDVSELHLKAPDSWDVMSVTCPACGMSNSIAWGSMGQAPFKHAVAMLADSWNSR